MRRILYLPVDNAKINHNYAYRFEQDKESKDIFSLDEKHDGDKLNIETTDVEKPKGYRLKGKISDAVKDFRRRSYRNTCNRAAAKACKKACINACRTFCRMYSCSRRARKTFKTECKYSCRSKFKSDRYGSDTE